MQTCETCNNSYAKCLQITSADGSVHYFDSFECAIHALAPVCAACGCRVVGHGLEIAETIYCCEHCGRADNGVHA